MRTSSRSLRSRSFAVLLTALLAVSAVGAAAVPAAAQGGTDRIKFTVTLTSKQQILEKVGRGGKITYGWNQLTGTADTDSGNVDVQLLGNVEYLDGSGRFFGSLTLKFASLSTLGLDMEGRATVQEDGSTDLKAKLRVMGGNAAMTGAKGKGTFTGGRAAEVGSPIEITIDLRLRGLD